MIFYYKKGDLETANELMSHTIAGVYNTKKQLEEVSDELRASDYKYSSVVDKIDELVYKAHVQVKECEQLSAALNEIIKIYDNMDYDIVRGILAKIIETLPSISIENNTIQISGIDDQTVIEWMEKCKNKISLPVVVEQYIINKKEWEKYKKNPDVVSSTGYIERQGELTDMRFGKVGSLAELLFFQGNDMTAADNSCGAIATYNAIHSLGHMPEGVDLPEILRDYSLYGLVLDGALGTSPTTMQEYLNDHNYETYMLVDGGINNNTLQSMQENYDTYILTAYNYGDDVMSGAHTINISYDNGKYVLHNSIHSSIKEYDCLADAVNGFNDGTSEPISVIGIREG